MEHAEYQLSELEQKQVEARGELVDMNMTDFLARMESANFPDYKLITDMLRVTLVELQTTYYQMKIDFISKFTDQKLVMSQKEMNSFFDTLASIGGLVRETTDKIELCSVYKAKKLPEVFKVHPELVDADIELVESK